MDNTNSQASIQVPEIPSNAESMMGTSKTDMLRYFLELVGKSQIKGINEEGAESLEINTLTKDVQVLKSQMEVLNARTPQKISVVGTNGTLVTVPLTTALSSNLYDVLGVFSGGSGPLSDIGWSVVAGSKTTSEFQVRFQGDATAYTLDLTVTPTHNL